MLWTFSAERSFRGVTRLDHDRIGDGKVLVTNRLGTNATWMWMDSENKCKYCGHFFIVWLRWSSLLERKHCSNILHTTYLGDESDLFTSFHDQLFRSNWEYQLALTLKKMKHSSSYCCTCLIEPNTANHQLESILTVLTPFRISSSTTSHQFLHQEFSPQTNLFSSCFSETSSQPLPIALPQRMNKILPVDNVLRLNSLSDDFHPKLEEGIIFGSWFYK